MKSKQKFESGFSLVEVTLAIGIISFAFIAVLGMIPTGLNTFRQAVNASIGSQIAQRVIGDAQQTDFDVLTQGNNTKTVRYFDDQGNEITPANPAALSASEQMKVVYWVNTRVVPATVMPNNTSFGNLATVNVQIVHNPGNQTISTGTDQLWSDNRFSICGYSGLVSRNLVTQNQ